MDAGTAQRIRVELRELVVQQAQALEAQTFGGLSDEEWRDFDKRQERIAELAAQLVASSDTGVDAA